MADLSCCRTNRKRSSFATKHFQRKSLKTFDLHPLLRRSVSFLARIITYDVETHRPSTVTLAALARRGLIMKNASKSAQLKPSGVNGPLHWQGVPWTPACAFQYFTPGEYSYGHK